MDTDRGRKLLFELEIERQLDAEKKNRALTILGICICAVLIPILICNIILIIKGYINPYEVPSINGYKPMMVLTDSMSPTIKSGDLIIIKEVDPKTLEVGDIITFFDPAGNGQTTVTHTVKSISVENEKLMFETKGDNNNTPDRLLVEAEAVIGIYQFRIPIVANIAIYMQTVPGLIICIFVPLSALVLYDYVRRRNYEKQNDFKKQVLLTELALLKAGNKKLKDNKTENKDTK